MLYPLKVPPWILNDATLKSCFFDLSEEVIQKKRALLNKFNCNSQTPLVSVVIPVWNEEDNLHKTLFSLANNHFDFLCELIVINNNSTDRTAELLNKLGVNTFFEERQGIGFARQMGLEHARGKYILTCDADTLYPDTWIQTMTDGLRNSEKDGYTLVKGTYSFIPSPGQSRLIMALYEIMGDLGRKIRYKKDRKFLTVLGFNFGFIKQKAIEVNGFITKKQRVGRNLKGTPGYVAQSEDGTLAARLVKNGGKLLDLRTKGAHVWTSDRRLLYSKNLFHAFVERIRVYLRDL